MHRYSICLKLQYFGLGSTWPEKIRWTTFLLSGDLLDSGCANSRCSSRRCCWAVAVVDPHSPLTSPGRRRRGRRGSQQTDSTRASVRYWYAYCPVDPWHFVADPDPWIHASDQWIRILLFSSLTFKTPTLKLAFFAYYFLKAYLHFHHFSKIKSHKEITTQ
jgi:hypothetical protein